VRPVYDRIGIGYTKHRCADPRIVEKLVEVIGVSSPGTLADIGAGTGNYSRAVADLGFHIEAVEPSDNMRRQASTHVGVRWHSGTAEQIPLPDHSADGVFCVLASHHFSSLQSAIVEMLRICKSGPIVWFTFEHRLAVFPWLQDYFPALWESTFEVFPPLEDVCGMLETHTHRQVQVIPWSVPYDLQDCFMAAGWRKPEMYLDPEVRACMSAFALSEPAALRDGLTRLRRDIETGTWRTTYRHLLDLEAIDWGYRFLRATPKNAE
jgi:ubiquinone/menaquinone biosynthesis C-methylase UbiE